MKNVNGEEFEIVTGSVRDLMAWIEKEPLPVTLRRGEFIAPLRTNNQRDLFVAGLLLGAELTVECAQVATKN